MVNEATAGKAKIHAIADKFTNWYIAITLVGSVLLFIATKNLNFVLAILLVTCADDIAVAVPLTFTAAISRAAGKGIIIKGADILETLAKVKIFVTDKTGTLTWGKPRVEKIVAFGKYTDNEFLELLATAEINSHHPVSKAIIKLAKEKNIKISAPEESNEIIGEGMEAVKNGQEIFSGKLKFLEKRGIKITENHKNLIEEIKGTGKNIIALGYKKKVIGFAVLQDELRPLAKSIIKKTRSLGVKKWIMLTGDNEKVAKLVADDLGIDSFKANLTPEDKLKIIKKIRKKSGALAMVGDGVNDAAALALADVSFAMSAIGSDVAVEAADIAIMNDHLDTIPEAIKLSQKTIAVAKQNFWIWGVVNAVGLFLVFAGFLGPVGASVFNFLTDFFPIFNALKMFRASID